jgi:ferredoxin
MKKTKVVLSFPPEKVEEPITYHLIKDHGLTVNIVRATIDPGKQGRMVVELSGEESQLSLAFNYLETAGVSLEALSEEIQHIEQRCTSCTACVPICPTGALNVDRKSWKVSFEAEKCVLCHSCVDVCIYKAVEVADRTYTERAS